MPATFEVTKRGPKGEVVEIHCLLHPACPWTMKVTGQRKDDDPILRAQFENHVKEAKTPDLRALGHMRRGRQ